MQLWNKIRKEKMKKKNTLRIRIFQSRTLWNHQKQSAEFDREKKYRSLNNGPKDLIRMRRPNAKDRRDTSGGPCCYYPLPVGSTRSSRWRIVVINFSTNLEKKKRWKRCAELLLAENTRLFLLKLLRMFNPNAREKKNTILPVISAWRSLPAWALLAFSEA